MCFCALFHHTIQPFSTSLVSACFQPMLPSLRAHCEPTLQHTPVGITAQRSRTLAARDILCSNASGRSLRWNVSHSMLCTRLRSASLSPTAPGPTTRHQSIMVTTKARFLRTVPLARNLACSVLVILRTKIHLLCHPPRNSPRQPT